MNKSKEEIKREAEIMLRLEINKSINEWVTNEMNRLKGLIDSMTDPEPRPFQRGDRVKYLQATYHKSEEADIINAYETGGDIRFDDGKEIGVDFNEQTIKLITPAEERDFDIGDEVECPQGLVTVADISYSDWSKTHTVRDTNGKEWWYKDCIFRSRPRPFERGDRVRHDTNQEYNIVRTEVFRHAQALWLVRDDGVGLESWDSRVTLITPAEEREIREGDTFEDKNSHKEFICESLRFSEISGEIIIRDKGSNDHYRKDCIFRARSRPRVDDGWKVGDKAIAKNYPTKWRNDAGRDMILKQDIYGSITKIKGGMLEIDGGIDVPSETCTPVLSLILAGEKVRPGMTVMTSKGWRGTVCCKHADGMWRVNSLVYDGKCGWFPEPELTPCQEEL